MRRGTEYWLERVRDLPSARVFVVHNPPTPRYGRAQVKLEYVVRTASPLGSRDVPGHSQRLEIAVWSPSPTGKGHGYYACFRLFLKDAELVSALLFCFYDGTEQSPGFRTREAAQAYAKSQDFEVN